MCNKHTQSPAHTPARQLPWLMCLFCALSSTSTMASDPPMIHWPSSPAPTTSDLHGTVLLARLQDAYESLTRRSEPAVVAIQVDERPSPIGEPADWTDAPVASAGSGVIIRSDGMILTCQHVIANAMAIHVTLHSGRRVRARPVAADPRSDLAIIQINVKNLAEAELGDARLLRRGHIVLALGHPLGLSNDGHAAVSQGLVSAIGRPLPTALGEGCDRYYGDMIEVSAPINPGNSGGPLINIHGRVVGIITAVSSHGNGMNGLGFAVPIDAYTKAIIKRLLQQKEVQYGYLGVLAADLTETQREAAALPIHMGALLDGVLHNGPADLAGLQAGDIVTTIEGIQVRSADHLIRLIGAGGPANDLTIEYIREGKRRSVRVKLVNRPARPTTELPNETLFFRGATLGRVVPAMRDATNLPEKALLVLMVAEDSPAAHAGLSPGDIIVQIDGNPLSDYTGEPLTSTTRDVLLGLANGGSILVQGQ